MQKLPTGVPRRPQSAHQAALAQITASGRAGRELQALDLHARHRGWPSRQDGEGERAYLARLRRQGMKKQEGGAS
jgi:hypothetical protein